MLLKGKMIIAGFPLDRIPGDDSRAKRSYLLSCGAEQCKQLVTVDGFCATLTPGKILMVPSGFMMSQTCTADCEGIRWGVGSDSADNERVRHALDLLLTAYPGLARPDKGMAPFLAYLGSSEDQEVTA